MQLVAEIILLMETLTLLHVIGEYTAITFTTAAVAAHFTFFLYFDLRISVDVSRYNPMTDQWGQCSSMNVPRNRVGVGLIDHRIYAVGGSQATNYHKSVEW